MRVLLALFLCFIAFTTLAQEPDFRNYTVENGLPSSECYQILQDKNGYIWIATDKGLSRYDGYRFQNFTTENGLPENCVLRMFLDPKGRIWFACLSGKMAIYENGKVKPLPINREILKKSKGGIINSICMYRDTLKLGYTCSSWALQIVHSGKNFKLLNDQTGLRSGAYVRVFPNHDTSFGWIVYDRTLEKKQSLDLFFGRKRKTVRNVFNWFNSYWFKAYYLRNKMYVLNEQILCVVSLKDCSYSSKLFDSRLLLLKADGADQKDAVWIGTMNGLFFFKDHTLRSEPVTYLKGKSVTDLYRDREGGIWIATLNNGIYYAKNSRVRHFFKDQKIFSMLKKGNKLLLGLDHGRMAILEENKINEYQFFENRLGYPLKGIFSIGKDQVIIRRDRLSVFSLSKRKVISRNDSSAPNAIVHDSLSGRIFNFERNGIGEYHSGVMRALWYPQGYQLRFDCAQILSNGKILAGTNEGLVELCLSHNQIHFIDKKLVDIQHIAESNQTVWLGLKEKGVCIRRKGQSYRINSASGLTSNYCSHIYLESASLAWISTNKGLTRVEVSSWKPFRYTCSQFSRKDGLISDELTGICEWNNQLVVAGSKGLSVFDKSKMFMPEYKPTVYLSDLEIDGKQYPVKTYYSLKDEIKNLVINFRGLCFRKEGKLLYRYRFGEADNRWQTTSNTSVEFNKVPYGNVVFEVQAQSTAGKWNTPIRKIVLFSPTPFFETTWFFILAAVVCGLLIWGFLFWRIRLVKKRASDRELLFRKASEMELKFLTGQMNPHFTFNAMNSIQHFMLQNDLLKAQNYLTKYSKLIRKVLENNMGQFVPLSSELDLLKLYVEIESMRFSRKIDFQIDCDPELIDSCEIPPMLIQPYIENAIWHGLFDESIVNGKIALSIVREESSLKCILVDNGIGRDGAAQKKQYRQQSESLGMLITQKRLDHLNGSNLAEPEIVDLFDEHRNPSGTMVIIHIPFIRI